jgi:1-acyl-sn-glycerol-3-phosphate acyltransferase
VAEQVLEPIRELPRTDDLDPLSDRLVPVGRLVVRALARLRGLRIVVHDAGYVPSTGPVIIASNHMGVSDGPALWGTARRPLHALTKVEMFDGLLGRALEAMGQIPVDRSVTDLRAVRMCLRVLRAGGCIVVYPEGGRGIGDVASTRGGAAYFALVTGAPVVPVAILGTRADGADIALHASRGSAIDVVYGPPLVWPAESWPRTKARVNEVRLVIEGTLRDHVREACARTGQTLPSMKQL